MKKSFAIAVLASFIVGGAQAQTDAAPISNPTGMISNFDAGTVGPILSELGIVWQQGATEDGSPYIAGNIDGQLTFLMAPAACRGPGNANCVGVNMIALFEGQANAQTVNAFNYRYAFASTGLDPSGAAYISRYEISDYGMARGNLATSLMVFATIADKFRDELFSATQTVSLEGYADDLSARLLNRDGLTDMTGVPPIAVTDIGRHQIGFEESARRIKKFIADKSTPRNKIRNVTAK
ncbi:MAG: YbjN domain-containing protein [Parvularculaceae bacterium]